VTATTTGSVSYDPYDVGINADPYPTFARLREEAPIFHNERYDFWALSRHADVEAGLKDWQRFSSAKGDILEVVQSGMEMPSGVVLFEDPPTHTMHRGVMSRVFTPRRMEALADTIREFCGRCLDPFVGAKTFDFAADLGAVMPMRVIGMLLGIPEEDQLVIRDQSDSNLRTEAGRPMQVDGEIAGAELFADYVEWRSQHPSDDLMTKLLHTELEDEAGTTRTLTREEVLIYCQVLAGAGNETTGRLIGWFGKVLGDHPDQRRELVEDPSLIPAAVEEVLRFEPTGPHIARWVPNDVEYYGQTVPGGSAMLLLVGAANRDPRRYAEPDRFDVHRDEGPHLTFGFGLHFCLGAALARVEGRIALEEILRRFPEWEVDTDHARLAPTSTVRGWETLPVTLP
jgi:cytochrome P450